MPNYQGMTDLEAGDFVIATDMDAIRENIEWLAGLQSGGASISNIVAGRHLTGVSKVAWGSYVGDGTGVAGSGGKVVNIVDADGNAFQPDFLLITKKTNAAALFVYLRGISTFSAAGAAITGTGFQVSDGGSDADPNKNLDDYAYVAVKF